MWCWIAVALAGSARKAEKAEKADPFSERNLAAAVAEIVPRVEAAAGRPFLTPPVVELATAEAFDAMLAEETELIASAVLRDTPQALRQELARAGGGVPLGVLGKYGIFTKKLYLCREQIEQATIGSGRPPSAVGDVARAILAHELTHALHDQHVDLAALVRGLPDQDALWAAEGTWEGLATWVEERVSAELGLEDAHQLLTELQGWSAEGLEHKRAYPIWAVYGRGRDAMAWHFEHGGFDRVWAVAARPPPQSLGVFRPERWPAERTPPPVDYAAVLRETEQKLTTGPWTVGISLLGEFELRGEAVTGGNEAAVDEVLAHLAQGWRLDASRPDRAAQVRLLVFDDPSWPKRYLDVLREQQTTEAADLATAIGREVEVRYEPFDQVPADDATLRVSRVAGAGGTWTERHAAWVVRGDTLVVVTAERFRPGLRMGWTVDEVFRKLDQALTADPPAHTDPPRTE